MNHLFAQSLLIFLPAASPLGQRVPAPHAGFGEHFAFCGDVDGDGSCDLAIGSRWEGGVGAVRVYSIESGELLRTHAGPQGRIGFGRELAALPDLDGDGVPEIASCSWLDEERSAGRIEVRSGRWGECLLMLEPAADEHRYGRWLTSAGDVDGDGKGDLAFAASVCERSDERLRFVVCSGRDGQRIASLERPSSSAALSPRRALAALGDVDLDGFCDLAILYGDEVLAFSPMQHSMVWTWKEIDPVVGGRAGNAICAPGDLDRDGLLELVVGQSDLRRSSPAAELSGRLRILTIGREEEPKTLGDQQDLLRRFGTDVAPAGDVDYDGVPDWIASDQGDWAGEVAIVSGRKRREILRADWPSSDSPRLGWRVEGGVDVDGDHVPDFAASSFYPTHGLGVAGQGVLVFSGCTGKRMRGFSLSPRQGGVVPPGG